MRGGRNHPGSEPGHPFHGRRVPGGDLSIAILSDAKVAEIHGDFLDDPTETDVITFPGDPDMEFAGEICVSADRALATHVETGDQFLGRADSLYHARSVAPFRAQ